MNIAALMQLATDDPRGFINALKKAATAQPADFMELLSSVQKAGHEKLVETAKALGVEITQSKKFAWGDTGTEQFDVDAIISGLVKFQDGMALQRAIGQAISGLDLSAAPSPKIQSAMKAVFVKSFIDHVVEDAKKAEADRDPNIATMLKSIGLDTDTLGAAIAKTVHETVKSQIRALADRGGMDSLVESFRSVAPAKKGEGDAKREDFIDDPFGVPHIPT